MLKMFECIFTRETLKERSQKEIRRMAAPLISQRSFSLQLIVVSDVWWMFRPWGQPLPCSTGKPVGNPLLWRQPRLPPASFRLRPEA